MKKEYKLVTYYAGGNQQMERDIQQLLNEGYEFVDEIVVTPTPSGCVYTRELLRYVPVTGDPA